MSHKATVLADDNELHELLAVGFVSASITINITRMSARYPSSDDTDAMVARVAPAILELLSDGLPRAKRAVVAALVDRYPKDEVVRTLVRLAVTDRVAEAGGKYTLLAPEDTDVG